MFYFFPEEACKSLVNHYTVISHKFVREHFLNAPDNIITYTLQQLGFAKYKGGKRITINGQRVGNIWYNKTHFGDREPSLFEVKNFLNDYFNYGIDYFTPTIATREEWGKRVSEDKDIARALNKAEEALNSEDLDNVAKFIEAARKALLLRYKEYRI